MCLIFGKKREVNEDQEVDEDQAVDDMEYAEDYEVLSYTFCFDIHLFYDKMWA